MIEAGPSRNLVESGLHILRGSIVAEQLKHGLSDPMAWVCILALPLVSYVTLGKSLNLSVHVSFSIKEIIIASAHWVVIRIKGMIPVMHLEQLLTGSKPRQMLSSGTVFL